jgi:hypothetical protein
MGNSIWLHMLLSLKNILNGQKVLKQIKCVHLHNLCTHVYFSAKFYVVCTGHTISQFFVKRICAHIAREDGRASFFFNFMISFQFYNILKCIKLEPQTLLSRAWQHEFWWTHGIKRPIYLQNAKNKKITKGRSEIHFSFHGAYAPFTKNTF